VSDSLIPPPPVPFADLRPMVDPARTALVVMDIQEDFASPAGALGRVGLDLSRVEPLILRIETLIAAARRAGAPLVFARGCRQCWQTMSPERLPS